MADPNGKSAVPASRMPKLPWFAVVGLGAAWFVWGFSYHLQTCHPQGDVYGPVFRLVAAGVLAVTVWFAPRGLGSARKIRWFAGAGAAFLVAGQAAAVYAGFVPTSFPGLRLEQTLQHALSTGGVFLLCAALYFRFVEAEVEKERLLQQITALSTQANQHERSVEDLRFDESHLEAMIELSQLSLGPIHEITAFALEEAVNLTHSMIGYLAFVNEDETALIMDSWSKNVMSQCAVRNKQQVFPVATSGLLGEAVRLRKPIITNDYAAPNRVKKGYPDGHVEIIRHMSVPVFDGKRVVAVVGVGNKPDAYDEADVRQLMLLTQDLWRLLQRKRAAEMLRESRERYRDLVETIMDWIWEVDADDRYTYASPRVQDMLGYSPEEVVGKMSRDFMPEAEARRIASELVDTLEERRRFRSFENTYLHKDGHRVVVETAAVPFFAPNGTFLGYRGTNRDITERKRAEDAIRRERDAAHNYLYIAGVIFVVIDANQQVALINRRGCEILGFEEREILGKNWFDTFLPEREKERTKSAFTLLMAGEVAPVEYFENPILTKHGEERMIAWHNTVLKDETGRITGTLSSGEDITERKRAEDALRLTQFAVDHAAEAIFWMGPDARFIYVNDTACRSLGYSRDELLAMSVPDIDPQLPPGGWPTHWEDVKSRKSFILQSTHRAKDGRLFPVEITVNYIEYNDREFNIAFARDITERKRAEEERRRLEAQVQQAQKLESLGVLAGGIAHDFNNLLTGILGNADLALEDLSPVSPAHECVQEIGTAARRAADLARQMLAYSGKGKFLIEATDLNEVVTEIAHLLDAAISKKATLQYNLAAGLPAVNGDPTQLRQVVMNLITNASESLGGKPGVIVVTTGAIHCDRDYLKRLYLATDLAEGAYVYLEVSDTGCGMDESTRAKIFDPFFTTKFTGRGLGLAAVLGIVRGHKGAINVYSEPGKGATFKVLLPCLGPAVAPMPENPPESSPWRGGGTILLADDEETVRDVGRRILKRAGFTVLTAVDGPEAIAVFRQHADDILCVILDLTMPGMDGEETYRELRRLRPEVRVILSSGYNEQDVSQRFVGGGLAGFVQKPYRSAELIAALRVALQDADGSSA